MSHAATTGSTSAVVVGGLSLLLGLVLLSIGAPCAAADHGGEFDIVYAEAKRRASGGQVPEMFFLVMQQRAAAGKSPYTNMGLLANYLADDYTLYSKVHSVVVREQCAQQGYLIGPYLSQMEKLSAADAAVTAKIYARLNQNYEGIWRKLKPLADANARQTMEAFATHLGAPANGLCVRLAGSPAASARLLSYPATRAERSEILRAIKP